MLNLIHETMFAESSSNNITSFSQIIVASSIGLIIAVAVHYKKRRDQKIIPRARLTDSGRVEKLERFPHYVG